MTRPEEQKRANKETVGSLFPLQQDRSLVFYFGLIALAFHIALIDIVVHDETKEKRKEREIVVERVEEDPKIFAETSRPIEQADDSDIEARFGGERKNRVKKETKSPRVGRFRQGTKGQKIPTAPDGEFSLSQLLELPSQQNSVLPDDVEEGEQTLLNTDEMKYASFIRRIRSEIYGPWVRRIQEATQQLSKRLNSDLYITKLRVSIDEDGSVIGLQTLRSSGYDEIDAASKEAFWETEPFPNPPLEIATAGPFVFEYEFHLELKSSLFGITTGGI